VSLTPYETTESVKLNIEMHKTSCALFVLSILVSVNCVSVNNTNINSILNITKLWTQCPTIDCIRLRDITALTLYKDKWTTSRRTQSIPQLECTSGCSGTTLPSVVQCTNRGWDGKSVEWACSASLDTNCRFDQIKVNCEGYSYSGDDNVLVGSCGLRYSLQCSINKTWIVVIIVIIVLVAIFIIAIVIIVNANRRRRYGHSVDHRHSTNTFVYIDGHNNSSNNSSSSYVDTGYGGTDVR
jgi:hypothetical protein